MNIALRRPDLIDRAVLNDIGPEIHVVGLKRIGAYLAKQSGAGAPKIDSWESAAAYLKERSESTMPKTDWDWFAKCLFTPDFRFRYDPAISLPNTDSHAAPERLWKCLEGMRRVLLVRGAESDILSKEVADRMAKEYGCKLVEVEGMGHTPHMTEPECLKQIDEFMKEK